MFNNIIFLFLLKHIVQFDRLIKGDYIKSKIEDDFLYILDYAFTNT